jgi:hypothetical protein
VSSRLSYSSLSKLSTRLAIFRASSNFIKPLP